MDFNDIKNLASSEKLADLKDKVGDVAHTVAEKAEQLGKSVNMDSVKSLAGKVGEKARSVEQAIGHFPGAAVDRADDDKATPCLEKQETKILNNNPRNNDL